MKKIKAEKTDDKKKKRGIKFFAILLVLLALLLSSIAGAFLYFSSDGSTLQGAKLIVSQPEVTLIRKGEVIGLNSKNVDIYAGDQIRTGKNAIAYIIFSDNSSVSLDENTQIEVRDVRDTKDQYSNKIEQIFGRTWSRVENLVGQKAKYELETPNTLAAVRGTQFICENDFYSTTCKGIEHQVSLKLLSNHAYGDEILLGENKLITHGTLEDFSNQDYKDKIQDYTLTLNTKWEIYTDCMNKSARNLIAEDKKKVLNYVIDNIEKLGCGDVLSSEITPTPTTSILTSTTPVSSTPIPTTTVIRTTTAPTKTPIPTTVITTTTATLPTMNSIRMVLHSAPIATAVVIDGLTCTWTGTDAVSYQVSLGTIPGNPNIVNWFSSTANNFIFYKANYTNMSGKTTYYCNVKAVNSTGQESVIMTSNSVFLP